MLHTIFRNFSLFFRCVDSVFAEILNASAISDFFFLVSTISEITATSATNSRQFWKVEQLTAHKCQCLSFSNIPLNVSRSEMTPQFGVICLLKNYDTVLITILK